jgi:branched-chain amino acid transport system substrate-binding protein
MKISLLLVAAGVLAAGSAAAESDGPIKLGVLYPLTGGTAVYGVPAMEGHRMAVDELNAKGGILGRKVESFERDEKSTPAVGSAAAKELIAKEGVSVLLGGIASSVGLAISDVSRQEKVPYVATIPKTVQLLGEKFHPYVFRTATDTDAEGQAMAYWVKKLNLKKLCEIQLDYAYGNDLESGIDKALKAQAIDVPVVIRLKAKLGATDYNAFIPQLMSAGCDGVLSGLWGPHFMAFAQQAKPVGLFEKMKFIGGGEVGSHEIAGQLKTDYPDNVISNTYELWYFSRDPSHKVFQAALAKRLGTEETPMWSMLAYNGVMFVAAAMEKAKSTDPDKVVAALEGLTIGTPVGPLTIDAKTHQSNIGQFWGPMAKAAGHEYREMSPIEYIQPKL